VEGIERVARANSPDVIMPRTGLAPLTAVIDIGSNSVRMVVFTGSGRCPLPVFNERTLCGLGQSLGKTGKLDPKGVETALRHLSRFAALTRAMGITDIEALATEAVRSATDGSEFVDEASAILGTPITILGGDREADTSAYGVIAGIPGADGMMGDLGGGSLEIVALDQGRPGSHATLPIGSLRLQEAAGLDVDAACSIVDKAMAKVDWLGKVKGRRFYPVGGAWRAFAAVHMGQQNYPLHVIHQYAMPCGEALDLLRLVTRMSPKSLAKIPRVPKARLRTLPLAAIVLTRLLTITRPKEVVFSAFGLREGWLYARLGEEERQLDPLLVGAAEVAARESRFALPGEELENWIAPLFADMGAPMARLLRAAVLLCDLAWRDHPDYRARNSFTRVLHMPLANIDHAERVLLALMVSASYGAGRAIVERNLAHSLVTDADMERAVTVGRALRLARTLCAGTVDILRTVRLERTEKELVLRVPKGMGYLMSDEVTRRFEVVARRLSLKPRTGE
jgi:exopolyphosphatase/guanosine-5'-triphosphate,3'-diphosphate pyrophosphatase